MSSTTLGLIIAVLAVAWVALFYVTFKAPPPRVSALLAFVGMLVVTGFLLYFFYVKVLDRDPDPARIWLARRLVDHKAIFLNDIVPGMPDDLDYVALLDTDDDGTLEWVAYYKYDVTTPTTGAVRGPFGASIYDYDECRPPRLLSFELVPVAYDYLARDSIHTTVENVVDDDEANPDSMGGSEVFVHGRTAGALTDLNVFRLEGVPLTCFDLGDTQGTPCSPNPLRYENIGSFRGNYRIERKGNTVTVMDRSPFERSEVVIARVYRPQAGTYFQIVDGEKVLLDPVESYLKIGYGIPDELSQVYYPEKAVLSFYNLLGGDRDSLKRAAELLSDDAVDVYGYDIDTDSFGLYIGPGSTVENRANLQRALVQAVSYDPNPEGERLHQTQYVTVQVMGIDLQGNVDYAHLCEVTWAVVGENQPGALPYGCVWKLDNYISNCAAGK